LCTLCQGTIGLVRRDWGHQLPKVTLSLTLIFPAESQHYRNNDALELHPGMIFTIEPMLVEASGECFEWDDLWTVATVDGGMAAQFEHTVVITEGGVEILTLPE
jgi:methionyl aminopeptidase